MRYGKEMRFETQIIIISVLILTLVTLRGSYSAFFSVESQSTIQQISTGTLNVIIDNTSSFGINDNAIFPTDESELPTDSLSVVDGSYAVLSLTNMGTLDAEYSITLGYDNLPEGSKKDELLSFDYLNVGIYDEINNEWLDFGGENYYINVSSLTPTDEDVYPIFRNTIGGVSDITQIQQYRIYVWLDQDTPVTEIGKLVYLKLDVKSKVLES